MYLFFTQHRARAYSQFDSGNVFSQVWRPKSSLYILVWLKHSILSSLTGLFLMSSLTETQYSLNHCIFSKTIKFDLNAVSPLTNLHSSIFLSSWSYCSFSAFLSELMLYFIIEYFRSARILFLFCFCLFHAMHIYLFSSSFSQKVSSQYWLRPTHVPHEVTQSQFRETNFGEQRDIRGLSAAQTVI